MRHPQLLLAGALLATPLFAQTPNYMPAGYAKTEGSSYTAYPFGLGSPNRIQYLYHDSLAALPVMVVNQIAFRGEQNRAGVAKSGVELEIGFTTTTTEPINASTTFASNLGQDYTICFTKKTVNLPVQPGTGSPEPFVAQFKLDKPYVYNRLVGNFLVDFIITKLGTGSYSHDCEYSKSVTNTQKQASCGGPTQALSGGSATSATTTWTSTLTGGPASGAGVFILGTELPAGLPLPGGCKLHVNPLFNFAQVLSGGSAKVTLPTPFPLRGVTFATQWITLDSSFTTWASSNVYETELGGYLNCVRIYNTSSATSATGSTQLGVAVVFELQP